MNSRQMQLPLGQVVPEAPVFGVQANFICYRENITVDYEADRHLEKTFLLPGPDAYADLCFLYLFTSKEGKCRIQCPAISFDLVGTSFDDVWKPFIRAVNAAALEAGKPAGRPHSCVTTAWKGETRVAITNAYPSYAELVSGELQ